MTIHIKEVLTLANKTFAIDGQLLFSTAYLSALMCKLGQDQQGWGLGGGALMIAQHCSRLKLVSTESNTIHTNKVLASGGGGSGGRVSTPSRPGDYNSVCDFSVS